MGPFYGKIFTYAKTKKRSLRWMRVVEYFFFIENRNLKTETDMDSAKMSGYKKGLAEDRFL